MTEHHLIVNRANPTEVDVVQSALDEPRAGELLVRVDRFALTSNNLTYAAVASVFPYLDFFPQAAPARDGWGRAPVWGEATVVASNVPDVAEGTRVFGFLPASSHAVLGPVEAARAGFRVPRPYGPAFEFYERYLPVASTGPEAVADMALRPLMASAYLFADWLRQVGVPEHGAAQLVVSSATSKTGYSLGLELARAPVVPTVALTSHAAAAERTGAWGQVLGYDAVAQIPKRPTVYLDLAGDTALRARLAAHLGPDLVIVMAMGLTHLDGGGFAPGPEGGPRTEVFFAPGWGAQRLHEGGAAFADALQAAREHQLTHAVHDLRFVELSGPDALLATWRAIAAGTVPPDVVNVMRL